MAETFSKLRPVLKPVHNNFSATLKTERPALRVPVNIKNDAH
jgi:hypothetical protein